MCAYLAAARGRRVRLIDKAARIGGKLPLTGGGKCNFTNRNVAPEHFIGSNPNFVRSALARFGPDDIIALFEAGGIACEQREHGRLFCMHSGRQIITLFDRLCREHRVQISLNQTVQSVHRNGGGFEVHTQQGSFAAPVLVVATGGVSYPQAGATDLGYRIARQFGLSVIEPRPGLVPLVLAPADRAIFKDLAGVSLPVEVACAGRVFRDDLLFTHRGLSGPAILQASCYLNPGQAITVNFLPGVDVPAVLQRHKQQGARSGAARLLAERPGGAVALPAHPRSTGILPVNPKRAGGPPAAPAPGLPMRLARILVDKHLFETPLSQATRSQLEALASAVGAWSFVPAGTEGLRVAETTLGGVDTGGISSGTMEARHLPGLYFIGEVLDVAGQLGGYSLHWAWAGANAAANAL